MMMMMMMMMMILKNSVHVGYKLLIASAGAEQVRVRSPGVPCCG
jgi:hypothetical protein